MGVPLADAASIALLVTTEMSPDQSSHTELCVEVLSLTDGHPPTAGLPPGAGEGTILQV